MAAAFAEAGNAAYKTDVRVAVGSTGSHTGIGAHDAQGSELGDKLARGLNEQLNDLGNDAVIKAGVHFTCAVDYARAGRGLLDGEAEVIFYSRCRE